MLIFIAKFIQNYFIAPLINVLFPSDCLVCLLPLGRYHAGSICLDCWASIKVIREPFCPKCGLPFMELINTERVIESVCWRCRAKKYHFSSARSLGEYSGSLKEIISLYKFGKNRHIAIPLSRLMMRVVQVQSEFESLCRKVDFIIAVPLHRKRMRERGFNQSFLIASEISKQLSIKAGKRILIRTKNCIPQSELPAEKREKNVKGTFAVKNTHKIRGKRILLIDDIFTTGSTVSECARVLKQAGARDVLVLTIAHTPLSRE